MKTREHIKMLVKASIVLTAILAGGCSTPTLRPRFAEKIERRAYKSAEKFIQNNKATYRLKSLDDYTPSERERLNNLINNL